MIYAVPLSGTCYQCDAPYTVVCEDLETFDCGECREYAAPQCVDCDLRFVPDERELRCPPCTEHRASRRPERIEREWCKYEATERAEVA